MDVMPVRDAIEICFGIFRASDDCGSEALLRDISWALLELRRADIK
jgi:hypothetical protein